MGSVCKDAEGHEAHFVDMCPPPYHLVVPHGDRIIAISLLYGLSQPLFKKCWRCVAGEFFVCLKWCLDEFSGQNIDIACEMVENAGAFMLRQEETAPRMQHALNVRINVNYGGCSAHLYGVGCFWFVDRTCN
jgi:hypothetical protein